MPKAVRVAVGHVNAILTLAHQHYSVDGHLLSVWHLGSFRRLLKLGPHFLVELGSITTPELQNFPVGGHAEDTLIDDGADIHFGHNDIGTVVHHVNGVQLLRLDFVMPISLEPVQVYLVANLADHVNVLLGPLAGVG